MEEPSVDSSSSSLSSSSSSISSSSSSSLSSSSEDPSSFSSEEEEVYDAQVLSSFRFVCDYCPYTTNNSYQFKRHFKIHTGENLAKCPTCGKVITSARLTKHLETHKDATHRTYTCYLCKTVSFSLANHQSHIQEAHSNSKWYKCEQCPYETNSRDSLRAHRDKHANVSRFVCPLCSYHTQYYSSIHCHRKHIHSNEPPPAELADKPLLTCSECQSFTTKINDHLVRHLKYAHNIVPPRPSIYQCTQCSFETKSKKTLEFHENNHRGIKPFKCSHCPYATSFQSGLNSHMKFKHANEPSPAEHPSPAELADKPLLTCSECQSFTTKINVHLVRHLKYAHNIVPPRLSIYQCTQCSFETKSKKTMEFHENNHRGIKPFKCSHCPYATSYQSCLITHIKHKHV